MNRYGEVYRYQGIEMAARRAVYAYNFGDQTTLAAAMDELSSLLYTEED